MEDVSEEKVIHQPPWHAMSALGLGVLAAMMLLAGEMLPFLMAAGLALVVLTLGRSSGAFPWTPLVRVRCRPCGALNPEAARFCNACGREL